MDTTSRQMTRNSGSLPEPALPKVLLVDDEPYILRLLGVMLRNEPCEIVAARDSGEALERIKELSPPIVIVDATMPRMNGYEVVLAIRADQFATQPYVIMLTSGGRERDREHAETAGGDEFMTKPFSPSVLRARVRELLVELAPAGER